MVFHWNLSDSKSPQVSKTLLSILADINVVVWIDSTGPLTSKSSCLFSNPLITVLNAPITSGFIVIFMFLSISSTQIKSRYLSFFPLSFFLLLLLLLLLTWNHITVCKQMTLNQLKMKININLWTVVRTLKRTFPIRTISPPFKFLEHLPTLRVNSRRANQRFWAFAKEDTVFFPGGIWAFS